MSGSTSTVMRPSIGWVIWNTLFAVVALTGAAAVWWPIYQSGEFIVMALGAGLIAVVVSVLGAWFRWPSILVLGIGVAAYLIAGVPLAVPSLAAFGVLPTVDGFLALLDGTVFGFRQLVTIATPVGSFESLLVPAFLSILAIGLATVSFALRLKHSATATVLPFLLAGLGIALGVSSEWWSPAIGVVLIVVTLVWLVWMRVARERERDRKHGSQVGSVRSSKRERRRSLLVTVAGASVVIAVAGFGGAVVASALKPSEPREVIRTYVEQPFNPLDYPSPLSGFRGYLQPDRASEALLTVSGLPEGNRLRIATLDTWNGVVYSVGDGELSSESGMFTRVPYRIDQDAVGEQVTLDVDVSGYTGVWVPGVGRLVEMSFRGGNAEQRTSDFFYNDNTGTGAVVSGLQRGDSYRVDSIVTPEPSLDDLSTIEPGDAQLPRTGELPDELTDRLETWTEGIDGAGERLVAMIEAMRIEGYISHGVAEDEPISRSGHGADRLAELFTAKPMVGDQEQYATAAALMAREIGFPARVVVGLLPGGAAGVSGDASPASSDSVTFTGADIHAWIEVQSSNGTWLTVDPTPPVREIPEEQPEEPTTVSRPQSVVQPPPDEQQEQQEQTPPETDEDDEQNDDNAFLAVLIVIAQVLAWAVIVAAIVSAPFLAVIAAKARRRKLRRTRSDPSDRIRGGWQEFRDAAVDHGVDPPPSATRRETAAAVGGNRALALAAVADRATFSIEQPTAEDADRVWLAVDDLRRSFDSGRTRRERFRSAVSLRSFRRRDG